MIRPENKNISNEHPFAKKAKAKRIEVVDVFDLDKYNKYKQAVRDDNVLEIFPDENIFDLEKMRKLFEKEMERQQS